MKLWKTDLLQRKCANTYLYLQILIFFIIHTFFLTWHLGIMGYVISVSTQSCSRDSNSKFFDDQIQGAENETKDIRVMLTQNPHKSEATFQMFEQRKDWADPIKTSHVAKSFSGKIFLNNSSKIDNAFLHEWSFKSRTAVETSTLIADVLKF